MSDGQISWGDAEWSRVRQIVHDEALRTRVAASFLPLFGPLAGASEAVPVNTLHVRDGQPGQPSVLELDDYTTKQFVSVSVNVILKNHMLADPELVAATVLFRRAAGIVARVEDAVVFNGKDGSNIPGLTDVEPVFRVSGAQDYEGLVAPSRTVVEFPADSDPFEKGPDVFKSIVRAVTELESVGYHRPFAVVLANDLFCDIHEPMPNSMVLPRDGIPPIIEGPLLRSSNLPNGLGVVISLQGDPVEIVVPSDISVRYLQSTMEGGHVFRISQRFLLRVKDNRAVAVIARKGTPRG